MAERPEVQEVHSLKLCYARSVCAHLQSVVHCYNQRARSSDYQQAICHSVYCARHIHIHYVCTILSFQKQLVTPIV